MKKIIAFLLAAVICLSVCTAFAGDITITINGEVLAVPQKPYLTDSGRTMVPMRAIFEKLGATVVWDPDTESIFAGSGDTIITLQIDNDLAYVNNQRVTLDAPARLDGEYTMVPARFVAQSLGYKVDWVPETETVVIVK